MSVVVKELYNEGHKKEFLNDNDFADRTQKYYINIFVKCAKAENKLKKDVCNFTKGEIEALLSSFDAKTVGACEKDARVLSSYIKWAIVKHYRVIDKKNPLEDYSPKDFKKFISEKKIFFSKREIDTILDGCRNPHDAVIISLLFLGASGNEGAEIRNLKKGDFDRNTGEILLKDMDKNGNINERSINVKHGAFTNDYVFDLLEESLAKDTYYKKNGMMEENEHIRNYTELIDNEYVLRNSITKTENTNGAVDVQLFYRRIKTIADTLQVDGLVAKNIHKSGMIYFGKLLQDRDGKLGNDQYKEIAERFGVNNFYTVKKVVNSRNIYKLYGNGRVVA